MLGSPMALDLRRAAGSEDVVEAAAGGEVDDLVDVGTVVEEVVARIVAEAVVGAEMDLLSPLAVGKAQPHKLMAPGKTSSAIA